MSKAQNHQAEVKALARNARCEIRYGTTSAPELAFFQYYDERRDLLTFLYFGGARVSLSAKYANRVKILK